MASQLEIDAPMLRKSRVSQFAKLYNADNSELLTLWLADQLFDVVERGNLALKAIQIAEEEIKI